MFVPFVLGTLPGTSFFPGIHKNQFILRWDLTSTVSLEVGSETGLISCLTVDIIMKARSWRHLKATGGPHLKLLSNQPNPKR